MALEVGEPAPSFTLRRTMDETVSLGELLARKGALIVFYVFDFGRY
jgi:peroxiredoxin